MNYGARFLEEGVFGTRVVSLHCCLILTESHVVLCNFDEGVGCSVMIVTKCGLIVQQSFVMIGQTVIHRLLTSLDVPKSVEKSASPVQR